MKISFITIVGGKPLAIMDNNEGITLDLIDGSPRIGCTVEPNGKRWKITGNNVDADCVGGVCPIK